MRTGAWKLSFTPGRTNRRSEPMSSRHISEIRDDERQSFDESAFSLALLLVSGLL